MMMRCSHWVIALGLAALLLPTPPTAAQTMTEMGYRPVDQTIEDIDPLGVSLRRVNPGLLTVGEQNNVYRRIVPGSAPYEKPRTDRLYYISYGVVAEFDQSQYIYIYDRNKNPAGLAQVIPANTIFHIGLPRQDATPPQQDVLAPGQISGRINGAIDDPPAPQPQGPGTIASYDRLVTIQRDVVIGALGRQTD